MAFEAELFLCFTGGDTAEAVFEGVSDFCGIISDTGDDTDSCDDDASIVIFCHVLVVGMGVFCPFW